MKNKKDIPVEAAETEVPETDATVVVADDDVVAEAEDVATATEAEAESTTPEALLAHAEAEIAELKDKNLRLMAEFDNYRKRTIKEKAELILGGGEKVLTALLPVLDDLERAMQNIEKSDDISTLREGVELIVAKLSKTLEAQGLSRIDTEGKDFDTDYHEAVALVPVEDAEQKGRVIDCVQAGYRLGDKVLRHAKVAVGQ